MITIDTPSSPWTTQTITLGGQVYEFTYSYNSRDSRWRIDITLNTDPVIFGVKIMENQSLLARYQLENFDHGDLVCIREQDDGKDVGLDNLGIGKAYELIYLTNDEIAALGG